MLIVAFLTARILLHYCTINNQKLKVIYPGKDEAMQKNYIPLTVSIYSAFIFKIGQIWQQT